MLSRAWVLSVACVGAMGSSAVAGITTFDVYLNGFNEVTAAGVPNQGDPDGFGLARLMIDDSVSPPSITWNITAQNIAMPLSGAHIHEGLATTTGPVRIDFSSQLTGSGLQDSDLTAVLANPTGWYVNLHNSAFPAGAIRGQIPAPGGAVVLVGGGLMMLRRRRR
jgi:hypothetical protein